MRTAVNICNSVSLGVSVPVQIFSNNMPCGSGASEGINRKFSQITSVNKIVQGLRSGVLVLSELVDSIPQRVKVFFEQTFLTSLFWFFQLPATSGRQKDC